MYSSSNTKIVSFIKESKHLSIPFQDIKEATKNFTTEIGRGGYGLVYRGELLLSEKCTPVAVKRLDKNISGQGFKEFLTEIQLLSRYKHPNLVSLLGFCEEDNEKILVYEYAENGSLDQYLRMGKTTSPLTWKQRIKICIDAARGLDYLHNRAAQDRRVIHRDIKSANILLDRNWKAMIADLGLSKIGRANENDTYVITNAAGTHGYLDPEFEHTGILTKESDVYSFGVVLFEVLCGRLGYINVNNEQRFLAPYARSCYKSGKLEDIIDPVLKNDMDEDLMRMFSDIAYQCLERDRKLRPSISSVIQTLEEILELLTDDVYSSGTDEKNIAANIHQKKLDREMQLRIDFDGLHNVFRWVDSDSDNLINVGELRLACRYLNISEFLVDDIVKELSEENDGKINFRQFLEIWDSLAFPFDLLSKSTTRPRAL